MSSFTHHHIVQKSHDFILLRTKSTFLNEHFFLNTFKYFLNIIIHKLYKPLFLHFLSLTGPVRILLHYKVNDDNLDFAVNFPFKHICVKACYPRFQHHGESNSVTGLDFKCEIRKLRERQKRHIDYRAHLSLESYLKQCLFASFVDFASLKWHGQPITNQLF